MTLRSRRVARRARVTDAHDEAIRLSERLAYAHYGAEPLEKWVRLQTGHGAVDVRLTEFGADNGDVPIVLLHGIGSATILAASLVPHLAGRRIIAVDWPGHGLSGPCIVSPAIGIRPHAVATLTSLLDHLGFAEVDLIGHSLGAQFSLYAAHDLGSRIRRIVLLGAPGAAIAGVKPLAIMKMLAAPGLGRALLAAPVSDRMFRLNQDLALGTDALGSAPPQLVHALLLFANRKGNAASIASFFRCLIVRGSVRADVSLTTDELRAIQQPTLFAWGDKDVFMAPELAAPALAAMHDVRLLQLTAAWHAPWLQAPDIVGQAVADHLKP